MNFIGYVKYSMEYQCYNPSGRKITTTTSMEFDERASTSEIQMHVPYLVEVNCPLMGKGVNDRSSDVEAHMISYMMQEVK